MKLPPSIRTVVATVILAVVATGCDGDTALEWHYWIAPLLVFSALFLVLVVMPLGYYLKVWRLKHRGRRA